MKEVLELIDKPVYAILDHGVFGMRIISGIVTGIRFTESTPFFEVSFGKDRWWTSEVFNTVELLIKKLELPTLARVKESHGLQIKYKL